MKKLANIERIIIKRMLEARKSYDYFMENKCDRCAFENAARFKEDVSLLYHADVINNIQFDLLYNLGHRMYITALNNTYIR